MNVDQVLRDAAAEVQAASSDLPIPDRLLTGHHVRAPARSTGPMWAVAIAGAVVVAGSLVGLGVGGFGSGLSIPGEPASGTEGLFGEDTGVMLLLHDGLEGVTAVDIDRSVVAHRDLIGLRRGDPPYAMHLVGERLVVGWGEPHTVDLATGRATPLGAATIFVPGVEPHRVWLVDYPGGSIGNRAPRVWQVDVITGDSVLEPVTTPVAGVAIGIQGGLALRTSDGRLLLWARDTGALVPLEPGGPEPPTSAPLVSDAFAVYLAWCGGGCETFAVTNTAEHFSSADDATEEFPVPSGYHAFLGWTGRFSPDGRYLAVLLHNGDAPTGSAIWVLDTSTGESTVVSDPELSVDYLVWAPDSDQLFATSHQPDGGDTTLWRHRISGGLLESATIPTGGITPVVIDASFRTILIGPP